MMSAEIPPSAGRKAMRSGDGDASAAAANGRTSHNQVSVDWAARLSRLSDSGRTFDCHNTTAPHDPFFRICSAAQSASAELLGLSQSTFLSSNCQALKAIVWGK